VRARRFAASLARVEPGLVPKPWSARAVRLREGFGSDVEENFGSEHLLAVFLKVDFDNRQFSVQLPRDRNPRNHSCAHSRSHVRHLKSPNHDNWLQFFGEKFEDLRRGFWKGRERAVHCACNYPAEFQSMEFYSNREVPPGIELASDRKSTKGGGSFLRSSLGSVLFPGRRAFTN
jgi:hypothetical protein